MFLFKFSLKLYLLLRCRLHYGYNISPVSEKFHGPVVCIYVKIWITSDYYIIIFLFFTCYFWYIHMYIILWQITLEWRTLWKPAMRVCQPSTKSLSATCNRTSNIGSHPKIGRKDDLFSFTIYLQHLVQIWTW